MNNKLKRLAVDHPYYCSEENYYDGKVGWAKETATDFLDESENADIDMNLCFRWDVIEDIDDDTEKPLGTYSAMVFIMGQRKGLFIPIYIKSIKEHEADRFERYLKKHWEHLNKMWEPLSK